jgi:hypothetical protein
MPDMRRPINRTVGETPKADSITTRPATRSNPPIGIEGVWPDVNTEMVTDHAKGKTDPLRQFLRIHMDIPVSEADYAELERAFRENDPANNPAAYNIIKRIVREPKPGTRRAHAVLDGALKPETTSD